MIKQMHHVGLVVDDFAAARDFLVGFGLELEGEATNEGEWVDRIIGLEHSKADIAMLATPDGKNRIELVKFHSPVGPPHDAGVPSNVPGLRHLSFEVDDLDATLERVLPLGAELIGEVVQYKNIYRLCYLSGPEGLILELAESIRAEDGVK
jgi:catechol 2,3-dioxygenase-like lactoylglutathione lyase family enzyme